MGSIAYASNKSSLFPFWFSRLNLRFIYNLPLFFPRFESAAVIQNLYSKSSNVDPDIFNLASSKVVSASDIDALVHYLPIILNNFF